MYFDNVQLQPGWKQDGPGKNSAEGCLIMPCEQHGTWKEFDRLVVHREGAYGAMCGPVILEA